LKTWQVFYFKEKKDISHINNMFFLREALMLLNISGILRGRKSVYKLLEDLVCEDCSKDRISLLMTNKVKTLYFKMAIAARAFQAGFTGMLPNIIIDPVIGSLTQ